MYIIIADFKGFLNWLNDVTTAVKFLSKLSTDPSKLQEQKKNLMVCVCTVSTDIMSKVK